MLILGMGPPLGSLRAKDAVMDYFWGTVIISSIKSTGMASFLCKIAQSVSLLILIIKIIILVFANSMLLQDLVRRWHPHNNLSGLRKVIHLPPILFCLFCNFLVIIKDKMY